MQIHRPEQQPRGAILDIHSWWGLTDSFHHYAASLSAEGYLVGLTDLFGGQVANTEEHARMLRSRPRRIPMYKILAADIASLREQANSTGDRIGIVGFSMGGHWAVWLSQRPEYRTAATVLYYSARAGDFSSCTAAILAHFAQHDPWVSAIARNTMERMIGQSGCSYQAFDYPGTQHWFAESERPAEFNEGAARLALGRDLNHFREHLSA